MVAARRATQAAALVLFLYLIVSARQPLEAPLPTDLFLRLDPLAQGAASLASRTIAPSLLWSAPLLIATLLLGRVFCGWICPMGTTLDLLRFRRVNRPRFKREAALRRWKYVLLATLAGSALAGSSFLLALDPLSLLTRTFATFIYPAFNAIVTSVLFAFYDRGVLPDLMVWIDTELRGNLLPLEQPYARLGWLFLLLFGAVAALNLLAHRFWCRYLCPLGGLLGLLSRWSPLGRQVVPDGCQGCGRCQASCRMGAVEGKSFESARGECVVCGECASLCPNGAVSYIGRSRPTANYDSSRRGFLAAGAFGALAVVGFRVDTPGKEVNPFLVRPPGAQQPDFLQRCLRCGQCVKVCPSSGLQPSLFQSGMEGLWSPILVSRVGGCVYDCNSCGQVCPTGAIQPLDLPTKQSTIIATAYIDQKRCIPWVDARNCIVCQELCPVSPKAVELDPVEGRNQEGQTVTIKRPRVVRPRCIGCGICENACPLPGEAAIRVYTTSSLLSEEGEILPGQGR